MVRKIAGAVCAASAVCLAFAGAAACPGVHGGDANRKILNQTAQCYSYCATVGDPCIKCDQQVVTAVLIVDPGGPKIFNSAVQKSCGKKWSPYVCDADGNCGGAQTSDGCGAQTAPVSLQSDSSPYVPPHPKPAPKN